MRSAPGTFVRQPATTREFHDGCYTLALATLIVRQLETSVTRTAVFDEIKEKNRLIRIVDRAYAMAEPFVLRRLLLCLYMLKCVVTLGPAPRASARALAVASFANEAHAVERVATLLPELQVAMVRPAMRHAVAVAQLEAFVRVLCAMPRAWRFLGRLSRSHSFMPACRISSVLAYYLYFGQLLDDHPSLRTAIVASNYSPESVALSAAAHRRDRRVVYVNHAPVPLNCPYVPPVLADYAVFYGNVLRQTYERRSRCKTRIVLIGQPGKASPLVWRDEPRSIGIYLTALTRLEAIERLVGEIKRSHPEMSLLIRHHPVALLETDLSLLVERYPDIRVTLGTPLDDDIAACDMVFCGNSGVVLNTLRGGRPVAYMPELDQLPFDYNGFVEHGLVPQVDGWSETLYSNLEDFYRAPSWQDVMRNYDASYARSSEDIAREARAALLANFSYTPASASPGAAQLG
jgi:hypothetical protein